MDQTEFEALIDAFAENAKQLVHLVETARYEQPTALAIAQLLDAREQLLSMIAKLPALRAVQAPATPASELAGPHDLPALMREAETRLRSSPDATAILELVARTDQHYAAIVGALKSAGRWPARNKAR